MVEKSVHCVPKVLQSNREEQPVEEKLSSYSPLFVGNEWKSNESKQEEKQSWNK